MIRKGQGNPGRIGDVLDSERHFITIIITIKSIGTLFMIILYKSQNEF